VCQDSLSDSLPEAPPPPWVLEPHRLVSLLEIMEFYYPEVFLGFAQLHGVILGLTREESPESIADKPMGEPMRLATLEIVVKVRDSCESLGLRASMATVERICGALCDDAVAFGTIRSLMEELQGRLFDELKLTMILALTTTEAEGYSKPRKGWDEILKKFPGTVDEIEEAGKCLALNRNTACVFHLMRLMECGLRALGKSLDNPALDPKRNPSWDAILKKCDDEIGKPAKSRCLEWQTDDQFFSTATANLRAVKESWRNPTMHVERNYDGEQAREIYLSVRTFMRHLAGKLSE
jgi:hypothetical protein